ncbi:MMPL family transporter [Streptomyces coeruleorubidus]|uniref:MMPL family transporter n=1 Tax=Streptomyces coeruleorubidus TaxID=116188 RepID=UPI0034087662
MLEQHDPQAGGYSSQIVLHDDGQSLSSLSSPMSTTVAGLEKLPHVLSAQNPLSGSGSSSGQSQQNVGPLSDDGKTAYITARFDVQPPTLGDDYLNGVDDAVQPLRSAGAEVEYGGPLGELARPAADDRVSELIGFGLAVIVLLVGVGSVLAAGVPLPTALISVVGGLAVLGLLAAAFTFATVSPTLATMFGLGVGIDYALFLITRHRRNLLDGADAVRAAGQAAATSGRAVLVSGCTVIIALAGLSASGVSFIVPDPRGVAAHRRRQGLGRARPGDHGPGHHVCRADHGEFAAFVVSDNIVVKMVGLGLAVSVLIDATVVRLFMVPAVMTLLGRHAWWAPRWLERVLPHIDAEGRRA